MINTKIKHWARFFTLAFAVTFLSSCGVSSWANRDGFGVAYQNLPSGTPVDRSSVASASGASSPVYSASDNLLPSAYGRTTQGNKPILVRPNRNNLKTVNTQPSKPRTSAKKSAYGRTTQGNPPTITQTPWSNVVKWEKRVVRSKKDNFWRISEVDYKGRTSQIALQKANPKLKTHSLEVGDEILIPLFK